MCSFLGHPVGLTWRPKIHYISWWRRRATLCHGTFGTTVNPTTCVTGPKLSTVSALRSAEQVGLSFQTPPKVGRSKGGCREDAYGEPLAAMITTTPVHSPLIDVGPTYSSAFLHLGMLVLGFEAGVGPAAVALTTTQWVSTGLTSHVSSGTISICHFIAFSRLSVTQVCRAKD